MTSGWETELSPHRAGGGTVQNAQREAARVGHDTKQAVGHVAHEAADQGRHVAAQGRQQARNLIGDVTAQARSQAQEQQQRAAESLRTLGSQLRSMADGGGQDGLAAQAARRGADAAEQAAGWLGSRQPGDLLREVRDYASRHPGGFLAGAAIAGLLAGRLTRALNAGAAGGDGRGTPGTPARSTGMPTSANTGMPTSGNTGMPTSGNTGAVQDTGLHVPPSARASVPMRHGPSGTEVGP